MALITCPECGEKISDKSEQCIHCGYPLVNTKCVINGVVYDFKEELPIALLEKEEEYIFAIGKIRKKTSLTLSDGCELVRIIRRTKSIPPSFTPKYPLENRKELYGENRVNKIECPYCHSMDTKKISGVSKAAHTAMFGILSVSRNNKQWHCNKCGSDF